MIVLSRPYPDISALLFNKASLNLFDLEFYPLGRHALLSGLIKMGVKKGDTIIVPAYICYSTIQPLEGYGYKIKYIDIDRGLCFSIDGIKKAASQSKVKAILMVHYFGFTQKLDAIVNECHKLGIKVVEAASHSFLSQLTLDRLDIKGDLEIFSMRKNFPVKDGGALRLNCIGTSPNIQKCSSLTGDLKYLLIRYIEKVFVILGINIYNLSITRLKNNVRNKEDKIKYDAYCGVCQPSFQLGRYLNNKQYLEKTKTCIIANFNRLSKEIDTLGFKLFVKSVDCDVPQAIVIYDETYGLVNYLRSNGIGAWHWPNKEIPKVIFEHADQYPNSIYFNKSLVALPVHQSLEKKHIDYMVEILKKYISNND